MLPAITHDPALEALFAGSTHTYEQNKKDWLAKLDASAHRATLVSPVQPLTAGGTKRKLAGKAGVALYGTVRIIGEARTPYKPGRRVALREQAPTPENPPVKRSLASAKAATKITKKDAIKRPTREEAKKDRTTARKRG